MMVQNLEDNGFPMMPFRQGFQDMPPPTRELMHSCWNMDNAFVRTDPTESLKIDKEKTTENVDSAAARLPVGTMPAGV